MRQKIKTNLSKSIKNRRIHVFLLFLILAFTILIFTKLSKEYTNTLNFEVNKINVPLKHVILNDSNTSLKITLKTHGFRWLQYRFFKPELVIDFAKDVDNINGVYIWSRDKTHLFENYQFGDEVSIINVTPDTLLFKYDVNLVKKVPVVFDYDIKFSQGFDLYEGYKITPDSIEVFGPHSLVSKIHNVKTETIILEDVKSDISKKIKLKRPNDNDNLFLSSNSVLLSATVKKFTEGTLNVPVTLVNVPKGVSLKYFPKTVNISYYISLDDFNAISTDDFIIECDFSSVGGNESFLVPKLVKSSKYVKQVKIGQKRIGFIIIKS